MQPHYGQVEWDELIQWEVQLAMVETVEVLLRDGVLRQVDASLLFLRLESGVMADQPQVGLLESKHLAVLDTVREEVEKRNSVGQAVEDVNFDVEISEGGVDLEKLSVMLFEKFIGRYMILG